MERLKLSCSIGLIIFFLLLGFNQEPSVYGNEASAESPSNVNQEQLQEVPEGYIGIYSRQDLEEVRNDLDGNYILMSDIDLSQGEWEPIGELYTPFTGKFDGNGYSISGLRMKDKIGAVGLFATLKNALIHDLGVVGKIRIDTTSTRDAYYGGITGKSTDSTLERVYSGVHIIVGLTSSGSTYAGGIAGSLTNSHIKNSFTYGNLTLRTIPSPHAVYGSKSEGSLAGMSDYDSTISHSYSVGNINGIGKGYDSSTGILSKGYPKITESFHMDQHLTDQTRKSYKQMLEAETYSGFDFNEIWSFDPNSEYPFPVLQKTKTVINENHHDFSGGAGTVFNPYKIKDADQLDNIRNDSNAYLELTNDIDLSEATADGGKFYHEGSGWNPIGTFSLPFTGSLDGNGHDIKGLNIHLKVEEKLYAGLFGYATKADIRNVGVTDGDILIERGEKETAHVGSIAGYLSESRISNTHSNNSITVRSRYNIFAGGIAGYVIDSHISDSFNEGALTGSSSDYYVRVGGITGSNFDDTKVMRVYNIGEVAAYSSYQTAYAGGIVATSYESLVENAFNLGNIYTSAMRESIAGGVAALASRQSTLSTTYNIGKVDGSSWQTFTNGGVVGINDQSTVNNSYFFNKEGKVTNQENQKTKEEMMKRGTFTGFDFEGVWNMSGDDEYPFPQLVSSPLTAAEKPERVILRTLPEKLSYFEGEDLDITGAELSVDTNFLNQFDVMVTDDMVSNYSKYQIGKQRVWIRYENYSFDFEVEVIDTPVIERFSGINRYETAVAISQEGWETSDTVVLARGDDFPDALAGSPLAYKLDAPILLTNNNELSASAKSEIQRLEAKNVVILGGTGAVSAAVVDSIRSLGINVERINGKDRFETAVKIAERLGGNPEKAIITYGRNFPDALSIASYAAKKGYPILLSETNSLPVDTKEALARIQSSIVIGGTSAIGNDVFNKLPDPSRIKGINRYETSAKITEYLNVTLETAFIATGSGFADGLTGSVLAAKQDAPLLLVKQTEIPNEIKSLINKRKFKQYNILGGSGAINQSITEELKNNY
jgi:putative cell wall-binding protein